MWPRDRLAVTECLRIGRRGVERWTGAGDTLSLLATQPLPQDALTSTEQLASTIQSLYQARPAGPVELVLESAWLPVIRVDTGDRFLRRSQVETLVRHRFGVCDWPGVEPVADWEIRIVQSAGSGSALAFGLAPRLKRVLIDSAAHAEVRWSAMTPALSWGISRLQRRWRSTRPHASKCLLWTEQDRTLVAQVESGTVVSLNPGAQPLAEVRDLPRFLKAERTRFDAGSMDAPIVVAAWGAAPSGVPGLDSIDWLDVCGWRGGVTNARGGASDARALA